eukprot:jgi/Galph1/4496/GphlegSOOS_G3167.1
MTACVIYSGTKDTGVDIYAGNQLINDSIILLRSDVENTAADVCHFLKNLASINPPKVTKDLLKTLVKQNKTLVNPLDRSNLHPFLIPLALDEESGKLVCFLRWPTPPVNMPIPIVETYTGSKSLMLLSNDAKSYIKRYIATKEANEGNITNLDLELSEEIYEQGSFHKSGLSLDQFIIKDIGPFPDVYENLANMHLSKGNVQSALITCEKAAVSFPGWGRSRFFHALVLRRLGRIQEARDAARAALQLPLWTLKYDPVEVAHVAGFQEPEVSFQQIYRRLAEDKREKDIENGKPKEQVALDRAAYLLDLAIIENISYNDIKEKLADLYLQAQLPDIAQLVSL